jgi:hypothetical protein
MRLNIVAIVVASRPKYPATSFNRYLIRRIVGNYRSQFARILLTASLEELIKNLRTKASGR